MHNDNLFDHYWDLISNMVNAPYVPVDEGSNLEVFHFWYDYSCLIGSRGAEFFFYRKNEIKMDLLNAQFVADSILLVDNPMEELEELEEFAKLYFNLGVGLAIFGVDYNKWDF
jgi:hypothetical protein